MLKVFRDNLKYLAWILWIVIAVFVLFVFVDFGGGLSPDQRVSTAAATVGKDTVSFREFERRYRDLERQAQQQFGETFNTELGRQLGLPQRALEDLVARKIMVAEARRSGFAVSDEELRDAILQYPAFLDEQGRFIGDDVYTRFLRSFRYDVAEFEEEVRNDLLLQKLNSAMATTIFISASDVETAYRDQAERAKIRFVEQPSASLLEQVNISQDELEAFFDAHRNDYLLGEQRIVSYLTADPNRIRGQLSVEDDDLRTYYRDNREEFTRQEQVRARHILLFADTERTPEQAEAELRGVRDRMAAGEDFAALASELSEDEASGQRGGDLGYFGRGRMNPAFEQAAFAAAPGEVVGPIRTARQPYRCSFDPGPGSPSRGPAGFRRGPRSHPESAPQPAEP
jgi:peptidyl-prolyl cis-trans isomerase D